MATAVARPLVALGPMLDKVQDPAVIVPDQTLATAHDSQPNEYPVRADLRKDIYKPLPTVDVTAIDAVTIDPAQVCASVLNQLETALNGKSGSNSANDSVSSVLYPKQCYWRDQLAFTHHLRTFSDAKIVASALADRAELVRPSSFAVIPGTARLTPAGPALTWIDCFFSFKTDSPATSCSGMLQLLPMPASEDTKSDDEDTGKPALSWKIWTLATWVRDYQGLEENTELLKRPSNRNSVSETPPVDVDVLIIGAGNAGLSLAARLKAFDVSYLAVDRCEALGDNWAVRYDNMRLHVEKAFVQMAYQPYDESVKNFMGRDDLVKQCKRYAETFDLNVWLQTTVKSVKQNAETNYWTVVLNTHEGERTVNAKHVVQATGVGSRIPYMPKLKNEPAAFKGTTMHSEGFVNGTLLKAKGAKSVVVVGSANTAFDIIDDCAGAGLQLTMIQRNPTYILPVDHIQNNLSFGLYNGLPVDIADSVTMSGPLAVGGQLMAGVHAMLAGAEPERYNKLKAAGFKIDSNGDIFNNLIERCGGHYMDMGQTALIADGKVAVHSGSAPVAYTSSGLMLADGTEVQADVIIWCTGYADKNVREVAQGILGEGGAELASKMDATWQLDAEGEIRGLYKRQLAIDNFWLFGGFLSQHRYYSRVLALQIKASLADKLPPAYRDVPAAK